MEKEELLKKIKQLPHLPGVYQYFDKNGKLLYIGKAKNLQKRVKSYWRFNPIFKPAPNLSPRILKMLFETYQLDFIVVDREDEALILENSLIKQLKPKYNILLRDDKTYPYIYIDNSQPFPRFEITRKVLSKKEIEYFGPFPNGAKALLDSIYELYPLVQKKSCLREKRACLFYQIKRCLAPCEGLIDSTTYKKITKEAKEAILNKNIIIEKLTSKMLFLAQKERFEEAAILRDKIKEIEKINISSNIDLAKREDIDIFAIDINKDLKRGVVVKIFLRDGKIISSSHSYFRDIELFDINEAYRQVLIDHYKNPPALIAKNILIAHEIEDKKEIEETISNRVSKNISIIYPKRGKKASLIKLALTNAKELLKQKSQDIDIESLIKDLCKLNKTPLKVEVFDNSHIAGEAPVGAMIVYEDGKFLKDQYRRYQLSHRDEYHQMKELLTRRAKRFDEIPPPDLWIIDGGATLLELAKDIVKSIGTNLDIIAISKEKIDAKANRSKGKARDIIHLINKESIKLAPNDKRLQWIQKLRDEAHRFAIEYHRYKRLKKAQEIELLEKRGIGKATIKKLLDYFGTFDAIKEADFEEIAQVTNKLVAKSIKEE